MGNIRELARKSVGRTSLWYFGEKAWEGIVYQQLTSRGENATCLKLTGA